MDKNRDDILNKLKTIHDLPTLPIVMVKLSKTLEDVNCCSEDIVNILSNDPAISAQLLKTVNSPLFARGSQKESTLKNAITRLGFREVKNIALGTSVFKMFDGVKSKLFDRTEFWKHCLATSLTAIEIAKVHFPKGRFSVDELHLAGLVHDLGKIILDAYFPTYFEKALQVCVKANLPLYEAEDVALGINHMELGCVVAEKWHLPKFAVETIKHHHCPNGASEESRGIVEIVHIANYIANTQELGAGGDISSPIFNKDTWDNVGVSPEEIQSVVQNVNEQQKSLNSMF